MKRFEMLEHTADVKFKAYGKNLDEAFESSGIALLSVMTDIEDLNGEEVVEFYVEEERLESLLYSFLEELIYLRDYREILFSDLEVEIDTKEDSYKLKCKATSAPITEKTKYVEVKAITYNEMSIEKKNSGYEIQAVLDV